MESHRPHVFVLGACFGRHVLLRPLRLTQLVLTRHGLVTLRQGSRLETCLNPMRNEVNIGFANSVNGGTASPLRRSARLSASSVGNASMPDMGLTNSSRRRGRRGKSNAMDTSAWTSSLYSTRDPSQVSSYYLRPYEEDHNDLSVDDSLSGLGSLLRGSQRPPHTPRSYVHSATQNSNLSGYDYAEEDKFMERVESEWRQHASEHDGLADTDPPSTTPELEKADDPVFEAQPTPQVPGLFRSVLNSTKRDEFLSSSTDEKHKNIHPENTRGDSQSESASGFSLSSSSSVWTVLFRCFLVIAVLFIIYRNVHKFVSLPTPNDPLVESRPWSSAGSGDELRERISVLEGALNKVWQTVGDVGQEMRVSQEKMMHRLSSLEQKGLLRSSLDSLERDVRSLKKHHAEGMSLWQSEKARIEAMLSQHIEQGEKSKNKKDNLAALYDQLSGLEKRLARAEKQVSEASEAALQAKRAFEPLRDFVPDRLPVRYDARSKQIRIDPAFWHEFRKVMPSPRGAGGDDTTIPPWHVFLAEHRNELEELFSHVAHADPDTSMFLDKTTFFDLMEAEISRAKMELTTRFNEHVHGLESDVLEKVRKQQESFMEQQDALSHDETGSELQVDQVRELIDAALAVFAADQIGRADYAQYSAGARVIPSLTSPTHEVRVQGTNVHSFTSMISYLVPLPLRFGTRGADSLSYTVRGRMPVVALHHDTSPGMCWPFSGSHGQLGVQLVRRIKVQAITVDHVPAVLSLDGLASAPREIEVWGIAETSQDRERVEQWRLSQAWSDEPAPVPPSPSHVFLGSFVYEAHAGSPPIQTFPVGHAVGSLGLAFRTVQFNILSNHGLRDFTCLYRVRVHGEPVG